MKYGLALAFGAISLIISIALSDVITDGAHDLDVEFRDGGITNDQDRFDKVWTKPKEDPSTGRNQDRGRPTKVSQEGTSVCLTLPNYTASTTAYSGKLYLFDGTEVSFTQDKNDSTQGNDDAGDVNTCKSLPTNVAADTYGTKAAIKGAKWSDASPLANEIGGIITLLTAVLPIVIFGGLVIMASTTAFANANMGASVLGKQLLIELGYIIAVLIIMRMSPSITLEATDLYWTVSSGATIFNMFGGAILGIVIALIPVVVIGMIFTIVAERTTRNLTGKSAVGMAWGKVRGMKGGGGMM